MLKDSFVVLGFFFITLLIALPLARYMKRVYSNEPNALDFLQPLEKLIFKFTGINPAVGMNWKQYLAALITLQLVWITPAFLVLVFQSKLFLNPAHIDGMSWPLAINTTISFLTSTNLQHYAGETGVSYFSQICVLTFLQFLSAATSLAAGVAIVRGLCAGSIGNLGNFYNDFIKSCTRILMPLCIITAIVFMAAGMPMNFRGPEKIITLQNDTVTVARGPVAAMVPIKELGSNGGGFYGANDAHPFENPNMFTFAVHFIIVLLLPMAFVFFTGFYINNRKFSWMIFGVMTAGLLMLAIPIIRSEAGGNEKLTHMGIRNKMGNMEGKEVRFGSNHSALYCAENIAIPAGTAVSVHDSYMPLSAIAMLIGMQIDAFLGGVGTGWINMLLYLIIAVFISTLMIGRSPEFMGKKIGVKEMQVASIVIVLQIFVPIALTAIACFTYLNYPGSNNTLNWLSNMGPHGFTTMLYEYVSSVAGNGSNFGGLGNNTIFWNLTTSFAMLCGRFIPITGGMMLAGLISQKKYIPAGRGTLRTDSATFGIFLFLLITVLSVLSLFVILMSGPVTEHFIR